MESKVYRSHAVLFPAPFQSHIKATLKFAKLLHHKGFYVTFVNTEFMHKRFLKSRGHNSSDGFPNFRFETIPDSLPAPSRSDDGKRPIQDLKAFSENIMSMLHPFLELLSKLNQPPNNPVTCIVSDAIMPFTITAAEKFGLPFLLFFPISASCFMESQQLCTLKLKGLLQFKDESCITSEYLDTVVEGLAGMKDMRIRDLLHHVRSTYEEVAWFDFVMKPYEEASKAAGIVIHTFDALEQQVLRNLSSKFPSLFAIGPFQLFLNQIEQQDAQLNSIGYSLWKEETECLEWLDSKAPNSVIYVNFGSIAFITRKQVIELAMGLTNSNHQFLWIIREDLVIDDATDLPDEFKVKAKEKGFIASWCPQEEVLNHPSIGGFLTHCGWGSTIESLSAGVPMICWPFAGDQPLNCRSICREWTVGMEIGGLEEGEVLVKRNEVEKFVRELMEGEKGNKLRNKAAEWKKLAEEAAANPDGSSFRNLDKLVNEILSAKEKISTEI